MDRGAHKHFVEFMQHAEGDEIGPNTNLLSGKDDASKVHTKRARKQFVKRIQVNQAVHKPSNRSTSST